MKQQQQHTQYYNNIKMVAGKLVACNPNTVEHHPTTNYGDNPEESSRLYTSNNAQLKKRNLQKMASDKI